MVLFFASLPRIFLQVFRSKRTIVSENALLTKENKILLRRLGNRRAQFDVSDKWMMPVGHHEETRARTARPLL
jgi:hypothetical protein